MGKRGLDQQSERHRASDLSGSPLDQLIDLSPVRAVTLNETKTPINIAIPVMGAARYELRIVPLGDAKVSSKRALA